MPKFRVKGCFKENAEDVELVVQANSYKDAERIANKKGILVADVLVVEESTSSESNTGDWYKPKKKSLKQKLITLLIVGFVLSAVITSIVEVATVERTGSTSSETRRLSGESQGAWAYMQQFVSDRLKSPKSAEYASFYDSTVTSLGGGRYRVQSYVDATNSFGGEIRTPFIGIIKRITIDGESGWELESLNLN
jgi:hypothetical protein